MADSYELVPTQKAARKQRSGWQKAVILAIEPQTPRINSVVLAPEQPFSFVAGQYVSVRVLQGGSAASRKYSIASAPGSGAIIELAIEALPGGEVSGYFHRSATPGETVELSGPKGSFTWSTRDGGPILLIAGGSGLVPLMSMLRQRALERSTVPVGLIYSASTWEDVLFRDELLALAEAKDGFELMLTLTRETGQRADVGSRRVDAPMIKDLVARFPSAVQGAYLCGSDPFVESAQTLLKQLAIAPGNVEVESYGV